MNSNSQKAGRLLQLYSVEALAEAVKKKDRKEAMIAELVAGGSRNVYDFARTHFHRTRQHIYCFENELKKLPNSAAALLEGQLLHKEARGGNLKQFYLVDDYVEYFVEQPDKTVTQEQVELWWPIQLEFTAERIVVRCTVLERDVSAALQGVKILSTGRRARDDREILSSLFKTGLDQANVFKCLDLNKGVKAIWNSNLVDALAVRFKKSRSTSEESMDEMFTLKKTDPTLYAQLISRPLQNCTFLFLEEKEVFVHGFQCNPTDGVLRFYRYTKGTESTDNVLRKILQYN